MDGDGKQCSEGGIDGFTSSIPQESDRQLERCGNTFLRRFLTVLGSSLQIFCPSVCCRQREMRTSMCTVVFWGYLMQLHESHDKLLFVCQGYIDRLSVEKLPPAMQRQLKEIRESPVPLYDGRLPWSQDLQSKSRFAPRILITRRSSR